MKIFICFTPLHVLIDQRIIEEEKIEEYLFVYFTDIDTEKNRYYFQKLSKNAVESHYVILKKSILRDIFIIYNIFRKIQKYKNLIYYSGKIKSFHNRFLMYLTNYEEYITFDDGSGNVSGDGYFYDENENIIFKVFFTLCKKKLLYKNLKYNMTKHYTIFDLPNVFPNAKKISLFIKNSFKINKKLPEITILLTNAFAEDGELKIEEEINIYNKILEKYNVTHIIKHPREKIQKINSNKIIEIKDIKIAEEKVLELLQEYNVTLIGIYSTVLLNLMGCDNLRLINIDIKLKKPIKNLKKILSSNIKVIHV